MKFLDAKSLIYLITDGEITAENFAVKSSQTLELIKKAVESKISLIQIREKQISAKLLFELSSTAAQITKNSATKLLINDRADVAFASKADGVHLTANSLPAKIIRADFPKDFIVGVSTHSLEKAQEAKIQGADFITFGSVFHSPNKGKPVGLNALHKVGEILKPFPVIALGGIDETNFNKVLEIVDGFAAIRFLNNAENLRKIFNAKTQRC